MPGRGAPPKEQSRTRHKPVRGAWQPSDATGWQHGSVPEPPDGLLASSQTAWNTWFGAWFAAHWLPANLPDLRTCIRLYDQVERGEFVRAGELRMWEDTLGITPKGQQDRRWAPPKPDSEPLNVSEESAEDPYHKLRVVG